MRLLRRAFSAWPLLMGGILFTCLYFVRNETAYAFFGVTLLVFWACDVVHALATKDWDETD